MNKGRRITGQRIQSPLKKRRVLSREKRLKRELDRLDRREERVPAEERFAGER
jgi:hypothetical protein